MRVFVDCECCFWKGDWKLIGDIFSWRLRRMLRRDQDSFSKHFWMEGGICWMEVGLGFTEKTRDVT